MPYALLRVLATLAMVLSAACGVEAPPDQAHTAPVPPPTIVRVEVAPGAVLMSGQGETRVLTARAFAEDGREVPATFNWTSSRPTPVDAAGQGRATAAVPNGSAQITASVAGVASNPVLAVTTLLPVGTVTVTDAQIVEGPVETDPDADASFDNTFRITLQGVPAPLVGALLVSSESKPVAGRVVAVATQGDRHVVTMRLESVRTLFPSLALQESFDLANAPVVMNPVILARYDVERIGDEWSFTPKPGTARAQSDPVKDFQPAKLLQGPFPFEKCETNASELPFSLSSPPLISTSQKLRLDLAFDPVHGLERLVVVGEVGAKIEVGTTLALAFEGSVDCETFELFHIVLPVPGPLGLVASGVIPVRAGLKMGGKLTVASASLGLNGGVKMAAQLGIACPEGNCDLVHSLTGSADVVPKWSASIGDIRFEPSVQGYGKVTLAVGSPFLKKLRFEAIDVLGGPKLSGSFSSQTSQTKDPDYKSQYGWGLEVGAKAGSKLDGALKLLGVSKALALQFSTTIDIGRSPQATISADRERFAAGDTVNVKVLFDRATLDFVPAIGPFNVARVSVVRLRPNTTFVAEVASVDVTSGTNELTIPVSMPDEGTADELAVFVYTRLLPQLDVFSLELGRLPPPAPVVEKLIAFSKQVEPGRQAIFTMDGTGQRLTQITPITPTLPSGANTSQGVYDLKPTWSPDRKRIAFKRVYIGESDLMVINADGTGEQRRLRLASQPAWSPRGDRIAYVRNTLASPGIFTYDVTTGQVLALVVGSGLADPSWSPDGRRIAFVAASGDEGGGLRIFDIDAGTVTKVPGTGGSDSAPAWSPDGKLLAYNRGLGAVVVQDPEQEAGFELALPPEAIGVGSVDWSPDGKEVIYYFGVACSQRCKAMAATPIAGGALRYLTNLEEFVEDPAWVR